MERYHRPVLLREVLEALDVKKGSWYLDCTLGDGGHALEILKASGNIVGIDVDPQAIERARERLQGALRLRSGRAGYSEQNFILINGNFRDIKNLLKQTDLKDQKFDGVLFDPGVSSLQLETPQKGFSFLKEGPLDMRMDPNLEVRALDLINAGGRKELYALFTRLGEEKNSYALADAVVSARKVGRRIETTRQLAEIIERVVGRKGKIHPATRVFQALRIAVNDELNALQEGLGQAVEVVSNGGRILVTSYHSLEDRIVKDTFSKWQDMGLGKVITKKPLVPSREEVLGNVRSRSAKMRVFEIYDYH